VSNTFTTKVSGKMSSRGWAIALGIGAVILAAVLLVVYLDRYRARVSGRNAPTPVLVAKRLIPKGTPGSIIASQSMYAPTTLPRKEVEVGAVSDPQYLVGRAASTDILPGQQFTAVDFAASDTGAVDSQITGKQRAISVSLDAVHASTPQVQAGDSVDIYIQLGGRGPSGAPLVKLFESNVKVLAVPTTQGPEGANGAFTLRMNTQDAAKFAYMADNTQMYWVIRPVSGAKPTSRSTATLDSVLR
jgi:Flp pilus assembly protein CpaB